MDATTWVASLCGIVVVGTNETPEAEVVLSYRGKTASATGLVTLVGEAAGKPTISLVRNDDGTITVTFTGKLQAAPTVNGPWQDVDADSPLTLTPDQAQTFARAVSE